jgi:hypothetical protein
VKNIVKAPDNFPSFNIKESNDDELKDSVDDLSDKIG